MQGFAVCPNLPFGLCPRLWDEAHMPEAEADDASLYGSDSAGSNPAAAWLLVLAGVISLGALVPSGGTSGGRRSRVCGSAALLGTIVGLYLALQLFPAQTLLQVGLVEHASACSLLLLCLAVVAYGGQIDFECRGNSEGHAVEECAAQRLAHPLPLCLTVLWPPELSFDACCSCCVA